MFLYNFLLSFLSYSFHGFVTNYVCINYEVCNLKWAISRNKQIIFITKCLKLKSSITLNYSRLLSNETLINFLERVQNLDLVYSHKVMKHFIKHYVNCDEINHGQIFYLSQRIHIAGSNTRVNTTTSTVEFKVFGTRVWVYRSNDSVCFHLSYSQDVPKFGVGKCLQNYW